MITRFAPKMIMGLAPEHSDVGNHRFWEMDKNLTIIKKRCGIHAFPSSPRKMKSPKIVFGNQFLFLGTDFSFLGAFLGKREDIGKEGLRVCVRKTTRAGADPLQCPAGRVGVHHRFCVREGRRRFACPGMCPPQIPDKAADSEAAGRVQTILAAPWRDGLGVSRRCGITNC